jgi:hypothetical protein
MLINVTDNDKLLAVVLRKNFSKAGINFLTESRSSLQVGVLNHPQSTKITPHTHQNHGRTIEDTQEVLLLRRGRLRVDFFTDAQVYLESVIMEEGDVLLLISGGHGFEALEDIDMVEVKTGPYLETQDKTRFDTDPAIRLKIRD